MGRTKGERVFDIYHKKDVNYDTRNIWSILVENK